MQQETRCVCPSTREGEFCEINLCSHCQNGGRCRIGQFKNETECVCPSPFYGDHCQLSEYFNIQIIAGKVDKAVVEAHSS